MTGAPGVGERMVLEEIFVLETLLPGGLISSLTPQELIEYRNPFPDPASRRPLLQWTREIPIKGAPADVASTMDADVEHAGRSPVRKLLVHAPGTPLVTSDVVS